MAFMDKIKSDQDLREKGEYIEDNDRGSKLGAVVQKATGNIERIQTGIDGFDNLVEGGLVRNSVVLVEGGAGSGKSIFCTQYIVNGITQFSENGIYISFEEDKESFFQNMARFGFDLPSLESQKRFTFLRYGPEQVEKVLASGGGIIRDAVDSIGAKRIVIDSLTAFTMLHDDELSKREAILNLFRIIKKWGCTTIVIGQPEIMGDDRGSFNLLEFECDGVIKLYNIKEHNVRQRFLEVLKLRGTKHAEKTFSMEITKGGIVIYPEHS